MGGEGREQWRVKSSNPEEERRAREAERKLETGGQRGCG